MTGKLKEMSVNSDGTQNITVTVQADFREMFDELYQYDIDVEIKKHSKRRSMDSNNLAWLLIDKIAEHEHKPKSEVYQEAIKEIGGVSEVVCVKDADVSKIVSWWTHKGLGWQAECGPSKIPACTNITLYCGSSAYNTRQMSELINTLVLLCNDLGIPTMSQAEIDKSLAYWQKKVEKHEVDSSGQQ